MRLSSVHDQPMGPIRPCMNGSTRSAGGGQPFRYQRSSPPRTRPRVVFGRGQHIEGLVETWLKTPFEGGRHAERIARISAIERGDRR